MTQSIPSIVIVGGGAGGLELATRLGHKLGKKRRADIVLVDKNRTHIWKPLLHEVATGSLDTSIDGVAYSAHGAKHGFRFVLGELTGADASAKTLSLRSHERQHTLAYDTLVIAIGSISNDFNTPGVKDHCYFLDSQAQAERFQHDLLNRFTWAHQDDEPGRVEIGIVGGGATGVELSAELYHVTRLLQRYGMSHMTPDRLHIRLIEAGPRILPALPERISQAAKQELQKLGVEVLENCKITEANEQGFVTDSGEVLNAQLRLWAAGVKVPDFVRSIDGLVFNRANQIECDAHLRAKQVDGIYVIGDACGFLQADGRYVPPRAQAAHQMADTAATNIIAALNDKPLQPFEYKDHGSLVNLARFSAVGSLMGNLTKGSLFVEGTLARLMYMSLYRMHQKAVHGLGKTIALWLAEKLIRSVKPKMKLH